MVEVGLGLWQVCDLIQVCIILLHKGDFVLIMQGGKK